MEKNVEEKIYLFLGHHTHIDDAIDAIFKIESTIKNISNKNKILLIEQAGWGAKSNGDFVYSGDMDDNMSLEFYNQIKNYYDKWISKIENNEELIGEEINWPTELYKFGYKNGYLPIFEETDYEITKEIFKTYLRVDEEIIEIQRKRDGFFIKNQVLPLIEKHPNKRILIVRGKNHEKTLPEILNKYNISFKILYYDSEKSKKRRNLEEKEIEKKKNEEIDRLKIELMKEMEKRSKV